MYPQVRQLALDPVPSSRAKSRRLVWLGLAAFLGAAAISLAYALTAFASGASGCTPGVKTINGVNARTFCGPAKATVKLNGKTVSYKGGECSKGLGLFGVNIGTVVLGNLKNKPEYFGVAAEPKAGTHTKQTITVVHAGRTYGVIGTVTIKAGLKAGTFAGKVFGSRTVISGSFTC